MISATLQHSVPDRLAALRELMRAKAIDAYIVPTGDPHMSEYTSDHYKTREFITGFTGSAGTAVITMDDAGLWTDSRYFLQAADQLEGSGITPGFWYNVRGKCARTDGAPGRNGGDSTWAGRSG